MQQLKRLLGKRVKPDEQEGPGSGRIALTLAAIVVVAAIVVGPARLATERERPPGSFDDPAAVRASEPSFEQMFSLYTRTVIEPGNAAEFKLNGDGTFPSMFRDLRAARKSICIQSYFSRPGAITDSLLQLLGERARAGVRVLVLLDAVGSAALSETWADSLRARGVDVASLRPPEWQTVYRVGNRSHTRVVTIDGRIAYIGGFGLADTWLGDGAHEGQWRETNVRVEGPIVRQLQSVFGTAWFEATGELIVGRIFFGTDSQPNVPGGVRAGVVHTQPATGELEADRFLALAIASAERRLYIASSYFVPSKELRRLLKNAARRGVDVRIITAGPNTDVRMSRYAGRRYYGELIETGIRIYEYLPAMMHAKTFLVDDAFTSVGSMNLDRQSESFNDEANVVVFDRAFTARAESMFMRDVSSSQELTLAALNERSAWARVLDWLAVRILDRI